MVAGGVIVAWLGVTGFTYPGMEEMAGKFNLPSRIYPQVSVVGLLLGPSVILIASVVASLYPALRLHRLDPVDAMRAA
jgi:ABC-type lipoprotein release transport system permease subunit